MARYSYIATVRTLRADQDGSNERDERQTFTFTLESSRPDIEGRNAQALQQALQDGRRTPGWYSLEVNPLEACAVCGQTFAAGQLAANGTIPGHGEQWQTCPGSYQAPR